MTAQLSAPSPSILPYVEVTDATPPRVSVNASQKSVAPRLLYRGALSLPDSNLLLDGITFTINIPADDPQASLKLLETSLPLALESMRGRPSLSFIGAVKIEGLHCDFSSGVNVHIHPRCVLTYQLFAHNLCVDPITSPKGHTDLGIRIRLGDSDAPSTSGVPSNVSSTNDIIVYGRAHPSSSILQLCVARVVPEPVHPALPKAVAKLRPPRPDDPTPRKPPVGFGIARIGLGMKRPLGKDGLGGAAGKAKSNGVENVPDPILEGGPRKKAKKGALTDEAQGAVHASIANDSLEALGKNSRIGVKNDIGVFKVPPLPSLKKVTAKVKAKEPTGDVFDMTADDGDADGEGVEASNKLFIKKAAMRLLTAAGIGKKHADFKEHFNHVYRGAIFALRSKMKSAFLDTDQKEGELVDRIVQMHVTMYLGGLGIGVYLLQ